MARRWAVILAGGSGKRLEPLTRRLFGEGISGEGRPKQFCALLRGNRPGGNTPGGDTLLGHTQARIAPVIPAERTAYVVVEAHAPYYKEVLADVPAERLLVQPEDRGTTAAVAYALASIAATDPDAITGFFPADHYFTDEDAFAHTLDGAYRLAALYTDSLLLLGAQPEHPEVEYGWIEPGPALGSHGGYWLRKPVFRVRRFWEKPSVEVASGLLDRGCLWNTFVMIGPVRTFLNALKASVPVVFRVFEQIHAAGRATGQDVIGPAYAALPAGDFSKQVLSALPDRLAVLRLDNVGWSDLGTPERLMATWSRFGVKPLTAA